MDVVILVLLFRCTMLSSELNQSTHKLQEDLNLQKQQTTNDQSQVYFLLIVYSFMNLQTYLSINLSMNLYIY